MFIPVWILIVIGVIILFLIIEIVKLSHTKKELREEIMRLEGTSEETIEKEVETGDAEGMG